MARCLLVVATFLAAFTAAPAWSSKDFPPFEAVHQRAIENVLKDSVSPAALQILEDQQKEVDKDQKASQSFEHSMTGLEKGQTLQMEKAQFIAQTEAFIRSHLTAAINARIAGSETEAFTHLGQAIHPLQDATSPAHRGFQPWSYNESIWAMTVHVAKERVYPDDASDKDQVAERATLEGATRWAFDIFMGKMALPDRFFDSDGNLLLPASYTR